MMAALAPVVGALALFGLPLFAVFGALTLLYFFALGNDLELVATNLYGQLTRSPTLVSIPLFTFAGYLMAESKTGERLVRLFDAWFGWMPGGLAIVCLLACAFFTTFTGASGVTIIAIGGLLYPVLLKQAYPERFSLGLITASGSLGLLFPPSLPIIIYGIVAGADIQRLFVAGILPGFVLIVILGFYCMWTARRAKVGRTPFRIGEALRALRAALWEALLPAVILGLMYSKLISVNETAVVAAVYVLIVEFFVYGDLSFRRDLARIVRESMVLVGAIFIILAVAISFTDSLIADEVPEKLFNFVKRYVDSQWTFLLLLNVFLLIVGCLMDIFSAIIVVVPLIVPVATNFQIDPTHLGIIFLANLEIGYMTPPVGINLFLSAMRFKKPVVELYRVSVPFLLLMLVALAIITYVPKVSLWLPEVFGMRARAAEAEAEVRRRAKESDEDDDAIAGKRVKTPPSVAPAGSPTTGTPAKTAPAQPADSSDDGLDDGLDDGDDKKKKAAPDAGAGAAAPRAPPAPGTPAAPATKPPAGDDSGDDDRIE
jgi:tripartite ATP-independent transporter DctM subunit